MRFKRSASGWALGVSWVLVSMTGYLLGFFAFSGLSGAFPGFVVDIDALQSEPVGTRILALASANSIRLLVYWTPAVVLQWLVLSRWLSRAWIWAMASTVGLIVGSIGTMPASAAMAILYGAVRLLFGEGQTGSSAASLATVILIMSPTTVGVSVGLMQGLVLRSAVYRAGMWVLAVPLLWMLHGTASASVFPARHAVTSALVSLLGWAVVFGVTGVLLVHLSRHPRQEIGAPQGTQRLRTPL